MPGRANIALGAESDEASAVERGKNIRLVLENCPVDTADSEADSEAESEAEFSSVGPNPGSVGRAIDQMTGRMTRGAGWMRPNGQRDRPDAAE